MSRQYRIGGTRTNPGKVVNAMGLGEMILGWNAHWLGGLSRTESEALVLLEVGDVAEVGESKTEIERLPDLPEYTPAQPRYRVTPHVSWSGDCLAVDINADVFDAFLKRLLATKRIATSLLFELRNLTPGESWRGHDMLIERLPDRPVDAAAPASRHTAKASFEISWVGSLDADAVLRRIDDIMDFALNQARRGSSERDVLREADVEVTRFELNLGEGKPR